MSSETNEFSDAIARGRALLEALNLTPAEKKVAERCGMRLMSQCMKYVLAERRKDPSLRNVTMPASLAFALIHEDEFIKGLEPKGPSSESEPPAR